MTSKMATLLSAVLVWSAGSLSFGQTTILHLAKDWETAVFPYGRGVNVAVCVDALRNVHTIASDGSWITMTGSGDVSRKSHEEELHGATTVACSEDGTVAIGVPGSHKVYEFSGDHRLLHEVRLELGSGKIVGVTKGSAVILGGSTGTMLKSLNLRGTEKDAMVDLGRAPASLASPTFRPAREGQGVFDRRRNLFIYIKNNPEQIFAYNLAGEMVLSKTIGSSDVPRDSVLATSTQEISKVWGIFPTASGYIVNLWQQDFSPTSGSVASHLRYQMLDEQFNVVGYAAAEGIGTIVATDEAGSVYGLAGGRSFTLSKAHLQ
jgi:hypothetical protein